MSYTEFRSTNKGERSVVANSESVAEHKYDAIFAPALTSETPQLASFESRGNMSAWATTTLVVDTNATKSDSDKILGSDSAL